MTTHQHGGMGKILWDFCHGCEQAGRADGAFAADYGVGDGGGETRCLVGM